MPVVPVVAPMSIPPTTSFITAPADSKHATHQCISACIFTCTAHLPTRYKVCSQQSATLSSCLTCLATAVMQYNFCQCPSGQPVEPRDISSQSIINASAYSCCNASTCHLDTQSHTCIGRAAWSWLSSLHHTLLHIHNLTTASTNNLTLTHEAGLHDVLHTHSTGIDDSQHHSFTPRRGVAGLRPACRPHRA